ncbi:MAG: hypothetical protein FJY34_01350 [Betaproteobacteria bacterium]|nr:hypothetical protein [Betaproteobacteria bacterium]
MTGFGGLDNPEPGLAAARALRAKWPGALEIEGLVYDAWSTGAWCPGIADRLHLVPPIAHGDVAVLNRILAIHRQYPIDVLIPCLDLEVPVFSRLATRLAREGIRTLLTAAEDVAAVTKVNLYGFCYAHKILTPHTVHVRDLSAVAVHADHFGYPLWVKGTVAGAKKVVNREQAFFEAEALAAKWGGGVLLQEAIEGSEHVVAMVARADGSCLSLTQMRKIGLNARGKGVVGATVEDQELKSLALEILAKLHWRGPLELEFVRSQSSGRFYLIEINCRFPSWIFLTEFARTNMPMALLREIMAPGSRAPQPTRAGAMYARDVQEATVPAESILALKRTGTALVPPPVVLRYRRGDITVGLTGISAFELTQPGLGVARCLRLAPEVGRIIGLAYTPNDTGLFRREWFDACCRIPIDDTPEDKARGDERLLDHLTRIKMKQGMDIVIPNLDLEIDRFQRLAPELARYGIQTLLPDLKARQKLSKVGLSRLSTRRGLGSLDFPDTTIVRSRRDVAMAWKRFGMPMILKGVDARAARVYSLEQALVVMARFKEDGETTILAQPTIFGEEFGVGVVCDRQGRLVECLPLKKLLMCERGKTWSAISTPLSAVVEQLSELLQSVGWQGPADVELIRDAMTDRMSLIEINPRFPAWIGYAAMLDVNLPRQLVLATLNRPAAATNTEKKFQDLVFMRTAEEIPAAAATMAALINRGEVVHGKN